MGIAYVPVAQPGELAPGDRKLVDFGERQLLVANLNGEYVAFARLCPHAATELDDADIDEARLTCPGHGWVFDLRSGRCLLPDGAAYLGVLPIEERDDGICVKLEW